MADRTIVKEPPATRKGAFSWVIGVVLKTIGLLMFSMLMSILIEWVGMYFFYPDSGYHHAEMLMTNEMGYLKGSTTGVEQNDRFINIASNQVSSVIDTLFIDSGVMAKIEGVRVRDPNDGKIVAAAKAVFVKGYDFIMAAVFIGGVAAMNPATFIIGLRSLHGLFSCSPGSFI